MLGVIFTEFVEMTEQKYGLEVLNNITLDEGLTTSGAYTAVGNYSHQELVVLCEKLSTEIGVEINEILVDFGGYMFQYFVSKYYDMINEFSNSTEMLLMVNDHIHSHVRGLYPDSNPPHFEIERKNDSIIMTYQSERGMQYFALGITRAVVRHFKDETDVSLIEQEGEWKIIVTENVK